MGGHNRSLNKLFDKELHNPTSEPNIVRKIKSERMKQARHEVCLRELTHTCNAHKHTYTKDFLKSLKGEVTGKTWYRCFDNIKNDLK